MLRVRRNRITETSNSKDVEPLLPIVLHFFLKPSALLFVELLAAALGNVRTESGEQSIYLSAQRQSWCGRRRHSAARMPWPSWD